MRRRTMKAHWHARGTRALATGMTVERIEIAHLGEEHFANCILRAGRDGNRAVAWGDRIIEMPLAASAQVREACLSGAVE